MDSKALFSPRRPGLKTYGCRTKNRDRPRGILLQKKQNKLGTSKAPANTSNFSLSDDSDNIQKIKSNERKTSSATQRKKSNSIQKQPRKTGRGRVEKKQPRTSAEENTKQRKEESQEMKCTPKYGLEQTNQLWVKTKIGSSDSKEDSIELPRRDQDMTWQEKISLLMPKMTYENHDRKQVSGIKSGHRMPGYSVLNLSAEKVMEEEEDETSEETDHNDTGLSMGHTASNILSLHSPLPEILPETDEKKENKDSKLPMYEVTSDEFTYTYEWVTDMGDSCTGGSRQASKARARGHAPQTISSLSKETVNRKSSTEQTNSDVYTYEWVTGSDTGQSPPASSRSNATGQANPYNCPSSIAQQAKSDSPASNLVRSQKSGQSNANNLVRISQNSGRSKTKHTDIDRRSHGYLNSTKHPGALSIFQAKFPVDLSLITRSPSQDKEKVVPQENAPLTTAGTNRQVQRMNSTRKKHGLDIDMMQLPDVSGIERNSPVKEQLSLVDRSKTIAGKVPRYLSSTRKRGGLDFDQANCLPDVSEIKKISFVEDRPGHTQLSQEKTPTAKETKPDAVTPMKSASVMTKKKRRLLPKSSTMLFVSGFSGLINPTPSLSAIRSPQNTVYNPEQDIRRDSPVKKPKTSCKEKRNISGSQPKWKEDNRNSGKILTSTPVSSTQTQFQRPEVNLTCVPRPCFEDELEFNESIEVNSDEIVPEDSVEDIGVEEEAVLLMRHRNLMKILKKTFNGQRKLESVSSSSPTAFHGKSSTAESHALKSSETNFRGKLSVKPITKITECCLLDPNIVFPRRKYMCYRKITQEVFKDRVGVSEDILLTHNFKKR